MLYWKSQGIGLHICLAERSKSIQILEQRIVTRKQQKWVSKLLGYDYEIVYKLGRKNSEANALSHHPNSGELSALSSTAQYQGRHCKRTKQILICRKSISAWLTTLRQYCDIPAKRGFYNIPRERILSREFNYTLRFVGKKIRRDIGGDFLTPGWTPSYTSQLETFPNKTSTRHTHQLDSLNPANTQPSYTMLPHFSPTSIPPYSSMVASTI